MATPVTPIPFVKPQFFDANGDPLAGGFIYTYDAGTLNPKATYTDSTGLVLNPNPVELDAGGFAEIWLASGDYKIAAQDSANVPQWTVDGVPGFQTINFLQDPGSNGIVVRIALGTTVARSIIGTAGHIVVTNGSGFGANPQVDIGASVALIDAANAWADGVKQTFNPDNTHAGINVGSNAAEPITPANGDLFYDSVTNQLKAYVNGAWQPISIGTDPTFNSVTITGNAPGTPAVNTVYKESTIKGWVTTDGGGAWNILADVNVSSITDNGVGDLTINWATGFFMDYCTVATVRDDTATAQLVIERFGSGGIFNVRDAVTGVFTDPTGVNVIAIGTLV